MTPKEHSSNQSTMTPAASSAPCSDLVPMKPTRAIFTSIRRRDGAGAFVSEASDRDPAAEATTARKVSDHGRIGRVYHSQARVPGCTFLCEETDLGGGFTPI